jgi:hypothetical protein
MGIAQVRKAIAAAVLAAAGYLVAASQQGSIGTNEYIAAGVAGLLAGIAVYFTPNAASAAANPTLVPPA